MRSGFTLVEVIIVVIIVGIITTFAMPAYRRAQERAYDNEADTTLRLLVTAERIYQMETGNFLNCGPLNCADIRNVLNPQLRLEIPDPAVPIWGYSVDNNGCAQATRTTGPNAGGVRSLRQINVDPASTVRLVAC